MTKQIINVGTSANDRKGDSLRAAFQKVNANFTELYDTLGAGSVSFDQTLNTTDSVAFNSIYSSNAIEASEYRIGYLGSVRTYGSLTPATVLGGSTTVVYSYDSWYTSAKLVIQVEGQLDNDGLSVNHTQTCEATIASTYNTATDPSMSVYGVIYTSVTPLATFTVRRAAGVIEILATNSQATNSLVVKVQALQFVSRYD